MRRTILVLAVVALVFGTIVGAAASIPSSDSMATIEVCVDSKDGTMRAIDRDAGQDCTSKEIATGWSTLPDALFTEVITGGGSQEATTVGQIVSTTVVCTPGGIGVNSRHVTGGGGGIVSGEEAGAQLLSTVPYFVDNEMRGWTVRVALASPPTRTVWTVYAICGRVVYS
jgi:hypothetical protein